MKQIAWVFICGLLVSSACKKTETKIIPNNVPQSDTTIENVLRDNFIHRSYVALLGRTPSELEKVGARTLIDKNNCSLEDRERFLNILFNSSEYKENLVNIDNTGLLKSISSDVIIYYINYYSNLVKDTADPVFKVNQKYVAGLKILKDAPKNYFNDSIDMVELHKRMTKNILFENLNGGIYNWINVTFPYFLYRKPTQSELTNSYALIQGFEAQFLLKTGNNSDKMIDIFFDADEYYEGQVRTIYLRNLYREPTNSELAPLAAAYKKTHNYQYIQKQILLSDDFLGKK